MGRIKEDRIEFEEKNYWDLQDKFMDKQSELFEKFVDEEYQSYLENNQDFEVDRQIDEERLNAVDLDDLTGSNQENFCN